MTTQSSYPPAWFTTTKASPCWPNETDAHWEKRERKLDRLVHQMYELAEMTEDDEYYYHPPSYVHPEP